MMAGALPCRRGTSTVCLPLMFFAIGFIKQSILHEWQAIYQYEMLLERSAFWIMAVALLLFVAFLNFAWEILHLFNIHVFAGCLAFSAYLVLRGLRQRRVIR